MIALCAPGRPDLCKKERKREFLRVKQPFCYNMCICAWCTHGSADVCVCHSMTMGSWVFLPPWDLMIKPKSPSLHVKHCTNRAISPALTFMFPHSFLLLSMNGMSLTAKTHGGRVYRVMVGFFSPDKWALSASSLLQKVSGLRRFSWLGKEPGHLTKSQTRKQPFYF